MKVNTGEKLGFELFHVCEAMKKLDVDELEVVREIDEYGHQSFAFNFDHSLLSHRLPCSWGLNAKKYSLGSRHKIDEQWPLYRTMKLEEALERLVDAFLNDEASKDGKLVGTLIVHSDGALDIRETEHYTASYTQIRLITHDQIENDPDLEHAIAKVADHYGESGEEGAVLSDVDIPIRYSQRSHFITEKHFRCIETDRLAQHLLDSILDRHENEYGKEVSFSGLIMIQFDWDGRTSIKIEHTIDSPSEETVDDRLRPLDALLEGEESGDLFRRHAPGEIAFCDSLHIIAEHDQIIIKNKSDEIVRLRHETLGVLRFALDLDGKSENAIVVPSLDEPLRIRFLKDRIEVATDSSLKIKIPYTEIAIDTKYRSAILGLQLSTFIRYKDYDLIETFLRRHLKTDPALLDVLKSKADERQDARLLSLYEACRMSHAIQKDIEKSAIKVQVRRPQI